MKQVFLMAGTLVAIFSSSVHSQSRARTLPPQVPTTTSPVYLDCDLTGRSGSEHYSFALDENLGTVTVNGSEPFPATYGATSVSFKHDGISSYWKEMVISRIDMKIEDFLYQQIGSGPALKYPYLSGLCTKATPKKRAF